MIEQLVKILGGENIFAQFSLKDCCSFKIGGKADFFATPTSVESLFKLIEFAESRGVRYKVIGNGTNLLFSDNGYKGIIISTRKMVELQQSGDESLLVTSGTSLSEVLIYALDRELSGLEFAVGIPGTVGGAIVMNAGTQKKDFKSVLKSVTVLESGGIRVIEGERLNLEYRSSYFLTHPNSIILFAEICLTKGVSKKVIKDEIDSNILLRQKTQPKERSAGCVFKKCGEFPAGLLIDKCGLKGMSVGDAMVSDVHANFIVNKGNAKAKDVKLLISKIKTQVYKKYNKNLELEIEILD